MKADDATRTTKKVIRSASYHIHNRATPYLSLFLKFPKNCEEYCKKFKTNAVLSSLLSAFRHCEIILNLLHGGSIVYRHTIFYPRLEQQLAQFHKRDRDKVYSLFSSVFSSLFSSSTARGLASLKALLYQCTTELLLALIPFGGSEMSDVDDDFMCDEEEDYGLVRTSKTFPGFHL